MNKIIAIILVVAIWHVGPVYSLAPRSGFEEAEEYTHYRTEELLRVLERIYPYLFTSIYGRARFSKQGYDFLDIKKPRINILPTYRCSLYCPFCFANGLRQGRTVRDMTLKEFKNILETVSVVEKIVFLGGEPFEWNHLRQAIPEAEKRGVKEIEIYTSGYHLFKAYSRGEGFKQYIERRTNLTAGSYRLKLSIALDENHVKQVTPQDDEKKKYKEMLDELISLDKEGFIRVSFNVTQRELSARRANNADTTAGFLRKNYGDKIADMFIEEIRAVREGKVSGLTHFECNPVTHQGGAKDGEGISLNDFLMPHELVFGVDPENPEQLRLVSGLNSAWFVSPPEDSVIARGRRVRDMNINRAILDRFIGRLFGFKREPLLRDIFLALSCLEKDSQKKAEEIFDRLEEKYNRRAKRSILIERIIRMFREKDYADIYRLLSISPDYEVLVNWDSEKEPYFTGIAREILDLVKKSKGAKWSLFGQFPETRDKFAKLLGSESDADTLRGLVEGLRDGEGTTSQEDFFDRAFRDRFTGIHRIANVPELVILILNKDVPTEMKVFAVRKLLDDAFSPEGFARNARPIISADDANLLLSFILDNIHEFDIEKISVDGAVYSELSLNAIKGKIMARLRRNKGRVGFIYCPWGRLLNISLGLDDDVSDITNRDTRVIKHSENIDGQRLVMWQRLKKTRRKVPEIVFDLEEIERGIDSLRIILENDFAVSTRHIPGQGLTRDPLRRISLECNALAVGETANIEVYVKDIYSVEGAKIKESSLGELLGSGNGGYEITCRDVGGGKINVSIAKEENKPLEFRYRLFPSQNGHLIYYPVDENGRNRLIETAV